MSNIIDKLRSVGKSSTRGEKNINRKSGFSGDNGIILRIIIGAAIYLLTVFPFMQNGFGAFLRIAAFILCSYDLILEAVGSILTSNIFTTKLLISVAGILAICVGKAADALLFILTYRVFSSIEKNIIKYCERSVKRILNLRTKDVKVYSEGKLVVMPTSQVKVGDHYMVTPGDRIPLDGIVVNGTSELDTEPLTGDSTLKKVHNGSPVLSGAINVSGTLAVRVTANLENSIVTKRLKYVESYKSYDEKVKESLKYFNNIFTPAACVVALFVGLVPPLIMGDFAAWLYRASILLTLACPLPIFASCAITYFSGVGRAAASGILFRNKKAIDDLEQTAYVVFDKNGTLSTGKFSVTAIEAEKITGKELLELAALAFVKSKSPITRAVLANIENSPDESQITNFYEMEGKFCTVKLADGRIIAAGGSAMLQKMALEVPETHNGDTAVYVCVGRDYMGCIRLSDKYRSDSYDAVTKLRETVGAKVVMISGESPESRAIIANNIGVDKAYFAVTEKEKAIVLKTFADNLKINESLTYVGCGEDAPDVHDCADVSIAMNGLFSDTAIRHSNVILVKSELSKLCTSIQLSRIIKKAINLNITIMTSVTALLALFAIFDLVSLSSAILVESIAGLAVLMNGINVKLK